MDPAAAFEALRRDLWSAGGRMLQTADVRRWQDGRDGGAMIAHNRDMLAGCAREARPAHRQRPDAVAGRLRETAR
ncbi:hypothetical protein DDF65_14155 [Caulobacter radicis]|uniref:Uncharacterized protein n=1 Tax=Caulobacter radicis TaxID=2172650 RepID=A0A2T9JDU5_9CAUL|nr:hypothetical protein DDF65_14155 [Caulobacter radicis]